MKGEARKASFSAGIQVLCAKHFSGEDTGFVYGLADGGLIKNLLPTIFSFPEVEACILTPELNEPEAGIFPVVLFKIKGPDSPEWEWISLEEHCTKILHLRSVLSLDALYLHLRKLLAVVLPEGDRMWLRFYDPVIFFPLLKAMDASRIGHIFGSDGEGGWAISYWAGISEDAEVLQENAPGTTFIPPEKKTFTLDAAQLEALDESYFRRMCRLSLLHMQKVDPEKFSNPDPATMTMLENAVDDAFHHGIIETETTPLYVECAFYWGPDFTSRLDWAKAIVEKAEYSGFVKMSFFYARLQKEKKK